MVSVLPDGLEPPDGIESAGSVAIDDSGYWSLVRDYRGELGDFILGVDLRDPDHRHERILRWSSDRLGS